MWRKAIVLLGLSLVLGTAGTASAALIAYWPLDGDAGDVADGHDGTLVGGARFVQDAARGTVLSVDGVDGHVVVPNASDMVFNTSASYTIMAWAFVNQVTSGWHGLVAKSRDQGTHYGIWITDTGQWMGGGYDNRGSAVVPQVWVHVAYVQDGAAATGTTYLDGVVDWSGGPRDGSGAGDFWIGAAAGVTEFFYGLIDDVKVFDHALAQEEVREAMKPRVAPELARDPSPADEAADVPCDVALAWKPGSTANTHDVYLGATLDDVNDAGTSDPKGVLVSQGQTAAQYDLDSPLEYGSTYFWRIDEVNGAPDYTVFKGKIWSFTTETYAYPITALTVTASAQQAASPAINTINGSGLGEFDQHGTDLKTMWATPGGLPAWIQYTFEKVYKLHELWVWNANSDLEAYMGFGAKDVTVKYSIDGETWSRLENVPEFAQGISAATYTANTKVDLGEVMARHVKLTINATWGATGIASLSEVRFFHTPAQAFAPTPADGATGVDLATTLNWRPGREVTSHEVYFGTDANAVAEGTVTAETVTDHRFTPASIDFGTKYYWRVDEVGDAGTYEGSVWSFTAQEFEPIDDFESYDDDMEAGTTIWHTWIDGLTTEASGSQVGYTDAPFAERTIVHGGNQSMPLMYDNATKFFFSEASRQFDPVQNWTGNGATDVGLWTRGYPAMATVAVTETSGKMTLTGAGADIWNNSDEFTYAYKTLVGDGALVARVVSIGAGSNTWAKGGVMIRDSLNGGSTHAMMVLTANTDGAAGNGASFQYRATTDSGSANADSAAVIAPPYWIRIQRFGDTFTGSVSADGKTWSPLGTANITMADPVYIGLCVTSHAPGEDRTYQFDGIVATGTVTGAWQGAVIDSPRFNGAANMYLTIQDSAGKNGTATSTTAVNVPDWTLWSIPMTDFAGVNFTKVQKMVITIGDKNATAAGGAGIVFIDDIGFGRSTE